MYLVIILYALFAMVFTIGKVGLEFTQPLFFVGSRMLIAGVVLIAYQFFFQRETLRQFFKADSSVHWKLFRLSLFNIYLTNAFEFWGLKYLASYKACFIYSLSPFFSALFSYFFLSEAMSLKKWQGLLIGCVGFLPVLLNEPPEEVLAGQFFYFSWAELAVIGAALCSVYGWVLLRQLVKEDCSPLTVNGLSMVIGGACALAHSFLTEPWHPLPITELFPFLECALALVLISNLICYNLYGYLLKTYTATFLSFAGFITPLFSALFGWYYLSETISWSFYLSGLIVFSGLYIFYQEELKQGAYASPAPTSS